MSGDAFYGQGSLEDRDEPGRPERERPDPRDVLEAEFALDAVRFDEPDAGDPDEEF